MKLLYITFIDFGEMKSGSSVRPQRMYEAFLQNGCETVLLDGQQNRHSERRKNVKSLMRRLDEISPDICYIEPPSGPVLNTIDLKLIKLLAKKKIPTAVFYRDAHWKFPEWWSLRGIKSAVIKYLQRRTLHTYKKYCNIMYFPSETMIKYFPGCPGSRPLPPGCYMPKKKSSHSVTGHIIYAGGISLSYGTDNLLGAVRLLRQKGNDISLTVICRENESPELLAGTENEDFITVLHLDGQKIIPEYEKADCAVIPLRKNSYSDFSMPIKLFEYISAGLPVITTDCTESARFVKKYNCGMVCGDTKEELAEAFSAFFADREKINEYSDGAAKAAAENQWTDRAKTVVDDLLSIKL